MKRTSGTTLPPFTLFCPTIQHFCLRTNRRRIHRVVQQRSASGSHHLVTGLSQAISAERRSIRPNTVLVPRGHLVFSADTGPRNRSSRDGRASSSFGGRENRARRKRERGCRRERQQRGTSEGPLTRARRTGSRINRGTIGAGRMRRSQPRQ